MTGRAIPLRAAGAALAALLAALPAAAAPGPRPQDAPRTCLVCHADRELASSAGAAVYVDAAGFAASVHGQAGIGCLDCHRDLEGVSEFPHAPDLAPVACARCHPDFARISAGAVHGTAGPRLAANPVRCAACHGHHDVRPSSDPRSSANAANRPATCGRCHAGAGPHFARGPVHTPGTAAGLVRTFYRILVPLLGALFLAYIVADLRRWKRRRPGAVAAAPAADLIPDDEVFIRMGRAERLRHGLLAAAFTVLAATGLPLLTGFPSGAAGIRGAVHRVAAIVLIAVFVGEVFGAAFSGPGRAAFRDRLPGRRDPAPAPALFGPRPGRPEPGRYTAVEKFDYWAMMLGTALMIGTGLFMVWPDLSLRIFPLSLHQAFVVAHGGEAVLAVLAVVVLHFYAAHLRPDVFPMSRVWLDGRTTGAEMRRRHPGEYRRVAAAREAAKKSMMKAE
jgi:cytochrome b subunit of formate dehydrogenase